jgi:hypothetical protein
MVARWRRMVGLVALLLLSACAPADAWPTDAPTPSVASGRWTRLPDAPLSARHDAVGAWVGGRFVVTGGRTDRPCPPAASCAGPVKPAERDGAAFDPTTGVWSVIAAAPTPISGRNVAVVDHQLYVLVEATDVEPAAFVRYDPGADRWDRLPVPSQNWSTLVSADELVIAVAGSDEHRASVDLALDPKTKTWRRLRDDPLGPSFDREATWFDGRLLLAAKDLVDNPGADGPALVRLAWWDPDSDAWSAPTETELIGWGPRAVGDRVVWPDTDSADGGEIGNWGRSYDAGGILDPATGSMSALPTAPDRDGLVASGLVVGSRVVVGPDLGARRTRHGGHLLDPATRSWTRLAPLPGSDRSAEVVAANDHTIFVWGGGSTDSNNLADGYLLRI